MVRRRQTGATLMLLPSLMGTSNASSCTICQNGENIQNPNTRTGFLFPDFAALNASTCQSLDDDASILYQRRSPECNAVQSSGSLCGCPINPNSCQLCGHFGPSTTLQYGDRPVPIFHHHFPVDFMLTCETMEAYLRSLGQDEGICPSAQSLLPDYCGCLSTDNSTKSESSIIFQHPQSDDSVCQLCPRGVSIDQDKALQAIPGFESCGDLDHALSELQLSSSNPICTEIQSLGPICGCLDPDIESPCTICTNGSAIPYPEKEIPFLDLSILGANMTCEMYDGHLQTLPNNTDQCAEARKIGSWCGCPSIPHHCSICTDPDEPIEPGFYEKELGFVVNKLDQEAQTTVRPTCASLEASLGQIPSSSRDCWKIQQQSHVCGCNDGVWDYSGADTLLKKKLMFWAPICSAFTSLMGSIFILQDIVKDRKKYRLTYYRITGGAAAFDLMSSVAWSFSSLAVPAQRGGHPSGMYNAIGTHEACVAQAFFIHTAMGTLMYSISLAVFYRSVIIRSWREERLKKASVWFHGIPITIGIVGALTGTPFYGPFDGYAKTVCSVQIYPLDDHWPRVLCLFLLPYCIASGMMIYIMLEIYLKVRTDGRRAGRWLDRWRQSRMEERQRNQVDDNTVAHKTNTSSSLEGPSTMKFGSHTGQRSCPSRAINERLEQQVFWQGLSYAASVNSSWPIICIASLVPPAKMPYWFALFTLILAPSQGFTFSLVYFRPRWAAWLKRRAKQFKSKQKPLEQPHEEPIVFLSREVKDDPAEVSPANPHLILPSQHSAPGLQISDKGSKIIDMDQSENGQSNCSLDPVETCAAADESAERRRKKANDGSKLSDFDAVLSAASDYAGGNGEAVNLDSYHSKLSLGLSVSNHDGSFGFGFQKTKKQKKYQERESPSFGSNETGRSRGRVSQGSSQQNQKSSARPKPSQSSQDTASRLSSQKSIPENEPVQESITAFKRESFVFGSTSGDDSFSQNASVAKRRFSKESYRFDSSDGSVPEGTPVEHFLSHETLLFDTSEHAEAEEDCFVIEQGIPKNVSFRQEGYSEALKTGDSTMKRDSDSSESKRFNYLRLKKHSHGCERQDPGKASPQPQTQFRKDSFEKRRRQSLGL